MDYSFIEKRFEELSADELYEIVKLRSIVFVVEQVCPYQDLDDLDKVMRHAWFADDEGIQAYVRIAPPGTAYPDFVSIGRVISARGRRGTGLGKAIFEFAIQRTSTLYPGVPIKISAQYYLRHFYANFGFKRMDSIYLEDGIPHVAMIKD